MVLESLKPDAMVNVRALTIENPNVQSLVKFDVERDIPPVIRGGIHRFARSVVNDPSVSFIEVQSYAISKLFYPNDLKAVNLSRQRLEQISDVFGGELSLWQHIKILNPSFSSSFTDAELESYSQEAIQLVEQGLGPEQYLDEVSRLRDGTFTGLKMLAPEKIANLKRGPQFVSQVNEYFSKNREQDYAGLAMARVGANLRILFWPNPSPYLPTEDDWVKMRSELQNRCRAVMLDSSDLDFFRLNSVIMMARNMQILAADELKITENGIETIFHDKPSFQAEPPPLPEARRF